MALSCDLGAGRHDAGGSEGAPADLISLVGGEQLQGYYGADQQVPAPEPRFAGRTIARLVLTLVIIAALATTLVSQPGSPLRNTRQIAAGGASVALILLFVRGGRTPR